MDNISKKKCNFAPEKYVYRENMKRKYSTPAMQVMTLEQDATLLTGSQVETLDGNVFNGTPTGGSGEARSRGFDGWGSEEENF